ncbi:hypothetical protein Ancab_037780 [Ancistrocladus abbreviatus]
MTRLLGVEDEFGEDALVGRLEGMKDIIERDLTTFVCICIPEFLSLYETERLVQELTKFEIDMQNIINLSLIRCCSMRKFYVLYDDFYITKLPFLPEEVCGAEALKAFSNHFSRPYGPAMIRGAVEE